MSAGQTIEIFKEAGPPREFVERFALARAARAATRSATPAWPPRAAVTTEHSHPFSTGLDLCLVHNGSLSNHNRLRQRLRREGIEFQTDNDSEVAAGYLTWRMREGATLEQALEGCLEDLDGFYTFAVGTADGFAVLRDPIACKPAVMAETDDWVAMASEYRAIAVLPGAEDATVWEPEPGPRLQLGAGPGLMTERSTWRSTSARGELNAALHAARTRRRGWRVLNPRGAHALAAGIDAPIEVEIEGHVGYYCAGMNKHATVRVHGNAGVGRGREHDVRHASSSTATPASRPARPATAGCS